LAVYCPVTDDKWKEWKGVVEQGRAVKVGPSFSAEFAIVCGIFYG
jgi:hypothetical protein